MNDDEKFTKEQKELIEFAIKYMGLDYEADKEHIRFFREPGKRLGIEFSPYNIKTKGISILFYNDYEYSKIKYILDEAIQLKQLLQIKSEIETDLLKFKQLQAQSLIYSKSIEFEKREMQPANKEYFLKSVNETNPLVISQFELLLEQINRDIQSVESAQTKPVQATQSPNNGIVYSYFEIGTDGRFEFKAEKNTKGIGSMFARCLVKLNKDVISKNAIEILSPYVFNIEKKLINKIKSSLRFEYCNPYNKATDGRLLKEIESIINSNCV